MRKEVKEAWTGEVIGKLHRLGASQIDLAKRCKYTPQYLCSVLNCKKKFESEYAKELTKKKIFRALADMEKEILGE